MIEKLDELPEEKLNEDVACCSDTSCCPPSTPIIRDTPKIGRKIGRASCRERV